MRQPVLKSSLFVPVLSLSQKTFENVLIGPTPLLVAVSNVFRSFCETTNSKLAT